ncbi:hypothetical protein [Metabacillus schmidteae]|uniref:hypothetical protein n=1 Tax=Metabacillus schmidteae TaxID=2730405 RepID=UPI001588C03C|nr:hypothetical protein [Metabacillus schmidteae]
MATTLSWFLFIAPWFLLIPLNPLRLRRFASVSLFIVMLSTIIFQIAKNFDWWSVTNNLFFLTDVSSFTYGFLPVTTLLVFYFTYPNPWVFFTSNILIDAIQAFIISPFIFEKIGLYQMKSMNNLGLFLLIISLTPIIFGY